MKLLKKDRINEVTLRFPSRSANESFARAAAAAPQKEDTPGVMS